jgi:YaiO family outer membrane protein
VSKQHYAHRVFAGTLSAIVAAALCATARADSTSTTVPPANGQVTVTDQQSTFSNPDYGPWSVQTLQYQWQAGKNDIPSFTILNRTDDDHPVSTSSRALYGDDYHTWSNTFYTYAQLSFANGNIQPYNLAYLEGDLKLDREQNLVAAAGGGATRNPDGTSTRWISAGPSFYTGPMVFEVRFMPANTNGIATSATEGVVEYNRLGHDQVTGIVLDGSQPSVLVGLPAADATFQRLTEYDLAWRHWITPAFGFVLGGTVGTHDNRATGTTLYDQHALTFGVFFGRAVAQPR